MRYCFFIFVLAAIVILPSGCEQVETKQKTQTNTKLTTGPEPAADKEPLLLLDDEPLLLLDDAPQGKQPEGPMADNSRCFVCHINYMQEDIAVIHARQDMGCAHCHGESDEHIADESWASGGNGTPPDIMYPLPKINPFCMGCHPADKLRLEQHKPLFADSAKKKYCTDCHGDHRLVNRKCKWK